MKRLLLLSSFLSTAFATTSLAQNVTASSVNATVPSASFSVDTIGNAFFNSLHSFDTINIDPNGGQDGSLPVASLPCHQVGQVYVLAQSCLGSQASSAAETYGYSFNMANEDNGSGAPASGAAGGSGTDKVVVYIGGDQQSSHSNLWGLNAVVNAENGKGGVAGAEWDLNRFATCSSKTDLAWIGDTSCPQFIGQWITGLDGGGTGGPAIFITEADGTSNALWNDGVAIAGGLAVRDTGFLDASNSNTVLKSNGTHAFGYDAYNSNITSAAIRLMSGNFWGPVNGQGVFWTPGPSSKGSAGATDSITDYGSGLTLQTDSNHVITLAGGNVVVTAGAMFFQNPLNSTTQTPFIQEDTAGNVRVGRSSITTGGLDVDGNIQAANLLVRGGVSFPQVQGNQTILTTDSAGSLHISGTGSSSALHVDEPTNFSNVSASGTVTANAVSSANAVSYGTGNSSGNHMVTEESLSVYAPSGVVALTPNGLPETATNNIAVITTGGAKVTADVMCQNGTDTSSWVIKGTFLVVSGTLKMMSSNTTIDIQPTPGADAWQVGITADTQNGAPEVVVGFPAGNMTNIDCTAHAEVITVK